MPRERRDEDLFQDSTMTFGEHLEELRICLWRAIFGIVLGFIVGIFAAENVVNWIQIPLRNALESFRATQAAEKVNERLDELVEKGYSKHIAEEASERRLAPRSMLVSPTEIAQQLGIKPDSLPGYVPAEPAKEGTKSPGSDLIPITLWQPIEGSENTLPKTLSMHEAFAVYIKAALLVGLVLSSPWVFYQIWSFVAAGLYPHEKKYIHIFLPISLGLFIAGVATVFLFVFQPVLDFLFMFQLDAEDRSGPPD